MQAKHTKYSVHCAERSLLNYTVQYVHVQTYILCKPTLYSKKLDSKRMDNKLSIDTAEYTYMYNNITCA